MQEFNGLIMLTNFFILSLLAILCSFLISVTGLKKVNSIGLRFYILIGFIITALTFWTVNLSIPADFAQYGIFIFGVLGLICTGIIVGSKKIAVGLSITLKILLVSLVGLFIGSGYFNLGIFYTLLVSGLLFIIKKYNHNFIQEQELYSMSLEITEYNLLPKIADMLVKFNLNVTKKSLIRKEDIILSLNYQATPIENFLFTRAIFRLDGIGEIIKI
jgi:uncharacterized membrane protein YhiD involved in acid resistance